MLLTAHVDFVSVSLVRYFELGQGVSLVREFCCLYLTCVENNLFVFVCFFCCVGKQ